MITTEVQSMKDEEEKTISEYSMRSSHNARQNSLVHESLIESGIRGRRQKESTVGFIKCCYLTDDKLQFLDSLKLGSPIESTINYSNKSGGAVNLISKVIEENQTISLGIRREDLIIMKQKQQKLKSESNNFLQIGDHCRHCRANDVIRKCKFNLQKRPLIELSIFEQLFKLLMFLVATILYSHQLFLIQANCQKHYFHHQNNQNAQFLQATNQDHLIMRLNQRQAIEGLLKGHNTKSIKQQPHHRQLQHHRHQQLHLQQQQQQPQLHHQYLHNHDQRRHQNYRASHMDSISRIPLPLNADRRASSGGIASLPPPLPPPPTTTTTTTTSTSTTAQPNQTHQKDNGKLLVCYYTTRQSAPYWPKDAREYVIPADGVNSINGANDLSQMAFAPILQYEPFARVDHRNTNQNLNNEAQQASPDFPSSSNIKNQQQQLVFKSAAMMQQSSQQQQQLLAGGPSLAGVGINTNAMLSSYNNGNKSKQFHNHQNHHESAAISQVLEQQQQQQQQQQKLLNSHNIDQQTLIIASQPIDNTFGSKNKQTPAYSFIGDLDSNNGLIFNGGSGTIPPTLQASINSVGSSSLATAQQHSLSGNNGNNLIFGKDNTNRNNNNSYNNNNNGNYPERNSIKQPNNQAQQLVFSPSMSRTFVVGPNSSPTNTNTNSNNEILDTKSQLLIPSLPQKPHQTQLQPAQTSLNNQLHHQQVASTSTTNSNLPIMYQQHDFVALQKAKSLQLTNGEQLSSLHLFSGPVSSTPPVPLSSASSSSLAQYTTAASYRNPQNHGYTNSPNNNNININNDNINNNNQQQQKQFLPNTNQLILSSGQTTSSTGGQKYSSAGGNGLAGMKLSYQVSAANSVNINNLGGKSSSSPSPSSSSLTNAGSSSSTSTNGASSPLPLNLPPPSASSPPSSASSSSSQSLNGSNSGSASATTTNASGNLSSALVSSPLSTMFDVFGAASQYLMRFKPSSLISPASFTFNTIPNDNHHHHSHQHHHGLKSSNSSLLSPGSPASLIPLPFTTSLTSSLQKSPSSSSSSTNDRSSNSNSGSVGIVSRFALQNNQRREDVCGKTIQTPQRRIIGGEGARYGEFPYQVHIKIAKHQCGGALVDKQSIVTAAHCVYHFITRAPVSKLQIVIGAYDIEDEQYQELPPQYFKVNKVKLHPNFRFSASHPDRYDIAILKLDKPVKYTDNVLPVCLPSKDLKFESMVGTVTGFGKTDPSLSNRYGTRLLQKVDVPIIENNECERWHRTRGIDLKIFPEMMCAGYEDGLKDACVGDSGGPLVVKTAAGPNGSFRWTLAGITSAGFGCAQSRQPGIYHRVSHTVDWILQNLD